MAAALTRGTIWLALIFYVASEFSRRPGHRATAPVHAAGRWLWTAGAVLYLAHVFFAFHFHHDWSHAAAWRDTARQTKDLFGFSWGGGIHFNYVFTTVWLAETVWWWASPSSHQSRSHRWSQAIRGFFLFMIFNGAVLFPKGWIRGAGLVLCLALVLIWRGNKLKSPRNPG